MKRIPILLRYAMACGVAMMVLFTALRLSFLAYFDTASAGHQTGSGQIMHALLLGARFDLRLTLALLIPVVLLGSLPVVGRGLSVLRTGSPLVLAAWSLYAIVASLGVALLYIIDFGHYAYLAQRLNASVLGFAADADASREMVWQTYPVVRIAIVWAGACALVFVVARKLTRWFRRADKRADARYITGARHGWRFALGWTVVTVLLVALGLHGRFSQYPLRWSDAYSSPDPFAAALALNPVLNLVDTLDFAEPSFDPTAVRDAYPLMSKFLGVDRPDAARLDFRRNVKPRTPPRDYQPNIVLVYLESFSAYKTSVFDNPLNPTPYFKSMADHGVLFDHFFTAHTGTARGVFAGLTGIPDVEPRGTSSRNSAAVNQHMIVNALKDYEKFYFIGGSTSWANIRGVLTSNIDGIDIHEEGHYSSPRNDVWGISDKNLFFEANKVLREQTRPFFAFIQTAGNHRPYTIPPEDTGFKVNNDLSQADLEHAGFFALDEFNSFRYMDWCIGQFIEAARKEAYFDHTYFVFEGDHGIAGVAGPNMPPAWGALALTAVHTPLLIYAPKMIAPARIDRVGMQVDLMPTIAGLAGVPYLNTTLGRDLFDPRFDDQRVAFTVSPTEGPAIGLLDSRYYLTGQADGSRTTLHDLRSTKPAEDVSAAAPQERARLEKLARAFHETARYMLTHNARDPQP